MKNWKQVGAILTIVAGMIGGGHYYTQVPAETVTMEGVRQVVTAAVDKHESRPHVEAATKADLIASEKRVVRRIETLEAVVIDGLR